MLVRLTAEYRKGGRKRPPGTLLNLSTDEAAKLIEAGVAVPTVETAAEFRGPTIAG